MVFDTINPFFSRCTPLPQAPSSIGPTTFMIAAPNHFDCFVSHQGQGAPATKISLFINIVTYYYDGTRKMRLDEAKLTVDPNTTTFPVSLTANMPSDGKVAVCEVNIQGTMCSECANGWSDYSEQPYSSCPNITITTTNPSSYIAAKPRWYGDPIIQRYSTTQNIGPISQIMNVPNSCGCTVN
jgi:hypothetical protein